MKSKWQKMKEAESKANRKTESAKDIVEKMLIDYCIARKIKQIVTGIPESDVKVVYSDGTYTIIQNISEKGLERLRKEKYEK